MILPHHPRVLEVNKSCQEHRLQPIASSAELKPALGFGSGSSVPGDDAGGLLSLACSKSSAAAESTSCVALMMGELMFSSRRMIEAVPPLLLENPFKET